MRVERAAACRQAGLDSLFVGDHHATGPAQYFQNVPVMGRLLAEWGPAPAGILAMLPLWHPVLLAEQIGTLAALAQGRFVLQCTIGGGDDQFAALGVERRRRVPLFEAHLGVLRRLLAGDEVEGVRIAPVPTEPLEVWVGAEAPPAIERAAQLGDGFLTTPGLGPAGARDAARRYLDAVEAAGRTPSAVAIRRDIHVGADGADARRVAEPVLARGYRGLPPDAPVVGGPEEVAAAFAALGEMGYTDVIVRHLCPDQADVLDSTARLAEVRALLGHR
jgi:alkanesulfonate monooxygenase SsuD/methylene tetrahydromethanopterin reductase-like flavin-dependent oxidoreductase (luciferase family)